MPLSTDPLGMTYPCKNSTPHLSQLSWSELYSCSQSRVGSRHSRPVDFRVSIPSGSEHYRSSQRPRGLSGVPSYAAAGAGLLPRGGHSPRILGLRREQSGEREKCLFVCLFFTRSRKSSLCNDHEGTRTLNLLIRNQTPYPLGHAALPLLLLQLFS